MLSQTLLGGSQRHTLPAFAFVLQEPRDYRKLAAIAEMLDIPDEVYIIDDYYKKGIVAAACIELLRDHGVAFQLASHVLDADQQFAVGVYQAITWKNHKGYGRELLPIWLWHRYREGRFSWHIARDVLTEPKTVRDVATGPCDSSGIASWTTRTSSARLLRRTHTSRRLFLNPTNPQNAVKAKMDAGRSHQGKQRGSIQARHLRLHMATSFKKLFQMSKKALARRLLVPIPLAKDLSGTSVLAPPYSDDAYISFPQAHIRDVFDFYLTATDRQREAVQRAVGKRAETIGQPHYWSAQAIERPHEELRRYLDLHPRRRIIAWLPFMDGLAEQIDYLQPLVAEFTIVMRPHPDLYLPEREGQRHEVQQHARAHEIIVQNSHSTDAGLLVRGANLVIAEGSSSRLSSIYLGANVAGGLKPLKPSMQRWDKSTGITLTALPFIDRSVLSSSELANLLSQPAWWSNVEAASDLVRRNLFGEITSADVGRQRCAAALRRLAAQAELQP